MSADRSGFKNHFRSALIRGYSCAALRTVITRPPVWRVRARVVS
jgi:hypothetical protein